MQYEAVTQRFGPPDELDISFTTQDRFYGKAGLRF